MSKESKSVSHSYKILQKGCLTFEDLHPFVREEAVPHVPPGSPSANMKGKTFVQRMYCKEPLPRRGIENQFWIFPRGALTERFLRKKFLPPSTQHAHNLCSNTPKVKLKTFSYSANTTCFHIYCMQPGQLYA